MSLPIPGCYFTLSLILFNISFGLLCSDPVQPISAAEVADKSIPCDGSCCLLPAGATCCLLPLPGSSCPLLCLPGQPLAPPNPSCGAAPLQCAREGKVLCYLHPRLLSPGKVRQTHNKL